MKTSLVKFALFLCVTAALLAAPAASRAQAVATNKTAAVTPKAASKRNNLPFHGKIASLDAAGGTLTVGKLVLTVTGSTKITKAGKTAALTDLTAGEMVGGSYKKDADGKLKATTINAGAKATKTEKPKTE